ncbi:hydantoinase/oxoprolinase family protein [Nocardioides marmoriginsengisoli]|uniref:Hydantoinase/oxoprolinase family protein n=1 Tax=Nocardioides marmoriginsengisoli TaxID=661483 RepID=A0A3N0CHF6_9ACTN|nr:hydantoinase/oxoprolinase family protein [Nocardioides marmoriginsengisoli]RNL62880.1 hydantoinase/oxoprolinase family protein [Nocardioides marmoriginsengisoli]
MADWRLAVDIGGTFTDFVLLDASTGRVVVEKSLSTPSRPLNGVRTGLTQLLKKAGVSPEEITAPIVHATTLITNALIEGKTGKAAMVTTAGFGDTLSIRTEHRYDMYDLQIEFPPPPIPSELTFEVDERQTVDGTILREPSAAELDDLIAKLREAEVEAVGICFLHGYGNGANERLVADRITADLGIPVCVSHDVAPQIREYPRMVTTACNAATMPIIGPYLDELQTWLAGEGFVGKVLMMLSNGGVIAAEDAKRLPIRLVESGPAAGALAGAWYAERLGEEKLLCFDMGGTTAKSCLIEGTDPALTNEFEVARVYRHKKGSGFPVSVPSVDLVEIGAGGGSLARVDDLGLLKVGPESAGAEPGPASYARGGVQPATTDADLLLGYLDAGYFLGGDMPLDLAAASEAARKVADAIDSSVEDTAAGIHAVVNQNMAAAARMHAVERGVDLRGVPLIAFGGAGPVHACGVAELLETQRVIFPVNASVLSAFGTLVSPVRIDLARSLVAELSDHVTAERDHLLEEMRAEGRQVLASAGVESSVHFRYGMDARYRGQGNEVTVWLGEGDGWPASTADTAEAFAVEYEKIYGMRIPDVAVEVVTWRIAAWAPAPSVESARLAPMTGTPEPHRTRAARFDRGADAQEVPVYRRDLLGAGATVNGPAFIEERETTAVIRPGWQATVTEDGAVVAVRGNDA